MTKTKVQYVGYVSVENPKERNKMTQPKFMDVPVGANKRYLVTCSGEPFAGFDKLNQAKMYVAMQKAKKKGGGAAPAAAAEKSWDIRDKRGY